MLFAYKRWHGDLSALVSSVRDLVADRDPGAGALPGGVAFAAAVPDRRHRVWRCSRPAPGDRYVAGTFASAAPSMSNQRCAAKMTASSTA